MSEKLVNKWLKKGEKDIEKDKERLEEEKNELIKAIETMLVNSFEKSVDDGIKALAKIHHNLFSSAVSGSEKAALALFYLRNNLNRIILNDLKIDLGVFFVKYSKHWFRLYLILESRAHEYISWISNNKLASIDFFTVLKDFNNIINIDYSIIDENHSYYNSIQLELHEISEQVSVESAKKLRNLMQKTLRHYLTNDDYKIKLQYIAFFISKSISDSITIQETFHEFAKDWYRNSLEFKKWFHVFIENLSPELEIQMYQGYNWTKFIETPLKVILKKKNFKQK